MNNAPKIVIATLERHYSPPLPPRVNSHENPSYQLLVDDYLKALKPFSDDTLERGMREFVDGWKYARWPKIGELVAIMRDADQPRAVPGRKHWKEGYWPAVAARRDAFVSSFMSGTLAGQARDEGWDDQLRQYVRKVAFYQAQILERCERKGRTFSSRMTDEHGYPVYPKEIVAFFLLEDLERHGAITVNIPTAEIDGMKARAAAQVKLGEVREKPTYLPSVAAE